MLFTVNDCTGSTFASHFVASSETVKCRLFDKDASHLYNFISFTSYIIRKLAVNLFFFSLINLNSTNMYGGMGIKLYTLLTSTLDGGEF